MATDPLTDLIIDDLFAAASLALDLHDRFGRYATAAGLGHDGTVRDLTVFTDDRATLDHALDRAHVLLVNDPAITSLVLLSSATTDLRVPSEDDLADFRHAREVFGTWGVEILDWIQTDRESIRSMRITEGSAWPDR